MERIDWVRGRPLEAIQEYGRWREAVEQADKGDSTALVAMLRSETAVLGLEARQLVADLLERHRLAKKRGRQAVPAYKSTPSEAKVARLLAHVRYYRRDNRQPFNKAVRLALLAWNEEQRVPKEGTGWGLLASDDYSERQLDEMIEQAGISHKEIESLTLAAGGRRGSTARVRRRRTG